MKIVNGYALVNNKITIVSEPDKGIYDAMNKGVLLANGDWIIFLGSDDFLHDDKVLEDAVSFIQNSNADFVYGDAVLMSNNKRYGGQFDILRLHTANNLC